MIFFFLNMYINKRENNINEPCTSSPLHTDQYFLQKQSRVVVDSMEDIKYAANENETLCNN